MNKEKIIVIGAGIAGLSAAWRLQEAGCHVTVLEAGQRPGGRIKSIDFHGHQIECGAQFPSSGYRYIPPLLKEMGLWSRVRALSALAAFQRGNHLYRVHARRPWTLFTSGMLGGAEAWRLARGAAGLSWRARGIDPSCYAAFSAFDDADAEHWCRDNMGQTAASHVIESTVHGLYFHRLAGTSKALIAAIMAFGGADTLAIAGGWQALPEALAAMLDVSYGATVERVEELPGGIRVLVNGEYLHGSAAVLATPAHRAQAILAAPTAVEARLLSVKYAATIHIALGLAPTWRLPANLRGVYGCLLAPSEGGRIAALTFESGRGLAGGAGEVISVMLGHQASINAADQPDDTTVREVVTELAAWLPDLSGAIVATHVQRWPAAEPLSPTGRAKAVAGYRATLSDARRIVLAGDYLGSPWTDGAAETGHWAARHLLAGRTSSS
ncbi:protoporphyrinogen/coproporphyrinogen oxidase [Rugamonas apoptosis]|uniref:FAD-dependent oxidoreductase n=1 Tax=Rugamonas apoptosis TaxID=2758570 RepID=A0A7W2FBG6_9BURK|nr:NAD(P)/FAD-dependent oxidoreductase [Rugamonas apoptosis]MBA5688661.1 FAD-dependent oxidoreductase [Rugamonas apoptosis]